MSIENDYSVCIKCSPRHYNDLRDRLQEKGVKTAGRLSQVATINRYIFEMAIDDLTDERMDFIIEKMGGVFKC